MRSAWAAGRADQGEDVAGRGGVVIINAQNFAGACQVASVISDSWQPYGL